MHAFKKFGIIVIHLPKKKGGKWAYDNIFFKEKFPPGFKEILEHIKYYLKVEEASIETTLIYYLENKTNF